MLWLNKVLVVQANPQFSAICGQLFYIDTMAHSKNKTTISFAVVPKKVLFVLCRQKSVNLLFFQNEIASFSLSAKLPNGFFRSQQKNCPSLSLSFFRLLIAFLHFKRMCFSTSVTSKKLPNVYKSCPKIISLEKC